MCGIAGLLSPDPDERRFIEPITHRLVHRGPDDFGFYHDEAVSLGHRRLSILDLSAAGRQPLPNETGDIQVVCNGEIYNYLDERQELENRGHRFRSHSDSETLVHLYEEFGDTFLTRLNGMFAFILWDKKRKRLIAAVDRFGKKPLYYARQGDRLAFASEMKGLTLLPWVGREIDRVAVDRYLTFRYIPAPLTILSSVKKLEPGTMLVWEGGDMTIIPYWRPEPEEPIPYDRRAVDRFSDLLTDAVRIRMQSDVPLGLYLSGGVDSSAVAGLMRRSDEARRVSYTMSFDYAHDEHPRAQAIAEHLGFEYNVMTVQSGDFSLMPEIVESLDEPFGDLLAIPSYLLAREAKKQLTVVLTGDGADEILNGYFHQKVMMMRQRWRGALTPPGVGHILAASVGSAPLGLLNSLFDYPDTMRAREREKLSHALAGLPRFGDFYEGITSCFTAQDKAALYGDAMNRIMRDDPVARRFEEDIRQNEGFTFPAQLSLLDLKHWIPFSVLFRLDKLNMAHAVETRSPFLDYRVVEMALNLAPEAKAGKRRNKEILRAVIDDLFPPHLREKGKQAFYMPMIDQYRKAFADYVSGLLTEERVAHRGLFTWPYVASLLAQATEGSMLVNRQLIALANLELWFQVYMDGDEG